MCVLYEQLVIFVLEITLSFTYCNIFHVYFLQVAVSTEHCGKNNVMELLKANMDICEHSPPHKYHLKYSPFTTHVSWTGAKEAVIIDIFTRYPHLVFFPLKFVHVELLYKCNHIYGRK